MARTVLLTCEGIGKSFGARTLFADLALTLFEGDRVGLVGPNGGGKTTLLRILAGLEEPDAGRRAVRKGLRVGYVPQDPVFAPGQTVEEAIGAALAGAPGLEEHERLQRTALALGKAGFGDRATPTEALSGGWRKRLAIARALAGEPDLLLLDEPTNHLDVEAILWLEELLTAEGRAFVAVSHDRYFLENIARRMLELDRVHPQGLLQVEGAYADFLEARDALLSQQASYRESLANLVRREIEWLRRGPKARTSKSKARTESAHRRIEELAESRARSREERASLDFTSSGRRTRRLWQGRGLGKSLGGRRLVEDLDLLLGPGSRLGVLGPNGSGKTTLLRMIVGELAPDEGSIERAPGLAVVYFEQNRESLDPEVSLRRALAPAGDSVVYRDRELHVASWARRFLFRADQLDTPVSHLSGGERARIVLARLMLRPADLLVLDEPTNDLDIPTLDVLEEALAELPGALVLVTHDRYLLERVTHQVLALDGQGGCRLFAGYRQWEASRRTPPAAKVTRAARPAAERPALRPRRLSYLEQREWDGMEERLLAAEARLAELRRRAEDPAVATDAAALEERYAALVAAQGEVEGLYARWAELEAKLA